MTKPTKKQLVQAIIDCNIWLRCGEGVNLLYYYENIGESDKDSYLIIKNIFENTDASN